MTNQGRVETPPVLRIHGGCVNPQVLMTSTGERIVIAGEVQAGSYLELDVFQRTVKLDGETNRFNLLDSEQTTWFELPVGETTLRLLASSFDSAAHVEVLYRDAYI